jgi:hypothetical protein
MEEVQSSGLFARVRVGCSDLLTRVKREREVK